MAWIRSGLPVALLAAACGTDSRPEPFTVADSSGVRIVSNQSGVWSAESAWVIDTNPLTTLEGNGADSTPLLLEVEGAMRLASGVVVVGDRGAAAIKYFDAAGRLLRQVGREGSGPGEFKYLAWLKACGADSSFAWDISNHKLSVFGPGGELTRTLSIETAEGVASSPFEVSCNRRGGFLVSGWGMNQAGGHEEPWRPAVPVSLADRGGRLQRTLGIFPGTEMAPEYGGAAPRRLGRWLLLALGDSTAWVAPGETSEIQGYGRDGALRMVVRTHGADLPVTDRDVQFHLAAALDSADSEADRERVRRQFANIRMPATLPASLELLVDSENHLWVQDFPRADAPTPPWRVYRPDGVLLGRSSLPTGLRVFEIGSDYVLGIASDLTGTDVVQVYRLNRHP